MYTFAFELNGFGAFLALLVFAYIFIYLPIKLVVKVIAHIKAKGDRIQKLNSNVVVAEYDIPYGLSPAEIGYLFDAKLSIEEVYATIVDLEQKGFIQLTEQDNKLQVNGVKNATKILNEFEKYVLINLKKIDGKNISKGFLRNINNQGGLELYEELNSKGYLKTYKDRVKGAVISILIFMAFLLVLFVGAFHPHNINDYTSLILIYVFFSPIFFIMATFLLSAYGKIVGEPWMGTAKLKQIWPEIEGYREYIKMVEADNLKFESENTKGVVKDKVLPYAIALGIDTNWKNKI